MTNIIFIFLLYFDYIFLMYTSNIQRGHYALNNTTRKLYMKKRI